MFPTAPNFSYNCRLGLNCGHLPSRTVNDINCHKKNIIRLVLQQGGAGNAVWPDLVIYCTLGNFKKLLSTINLLKSHTFLWNFCKGVKIYHFWASFIDIWRFFLVTLRQWHLLPNGSFHIWHIIIHLINTLIFLISFVGTILTPVYSNLISPINS